MVLSTGTLNLKFMQRAAARAAKAEPLAPATSGSVSAPAASAPSTPASPAPASITPSQAATPIPAMSTPIPAAPADDEAGAKWVLPRRNAEAGPGPSTRPRVQFVASYLPFLEDEDDGPTGMASGRMAFGMGAKLEEARDGDDNDEDEFISDSEDDVAVRRDKKARAPAGRFFAGGELQRAKSRTNEPKPEETEPLQRTQSRANAPTPPPEERIFQRPKGFSPPPTGKGKGKGKAKDKAEQREQKPVDKPKPGKTNKEGKEKFNKKKGALSDNLYAKLKDKLSISRETSVSSASSAPSAGGKKRARDEAAAQESKRPKVSALDEREKERKKAKKAAKRGQSSK
ncbi:unnamed protein product [Cutaneotrichosporon oleaginosum]